MFPLNFIIIVIIIIIFIFIIIVVTQQNKLTICKQQRIINATIIFHQ